MFGGGIREKSGVLSWVVAITPLAVKDTTTVVSLRRAMM